MQASLLVWRFGTSASKSNGAFGSYIQRSKTKKTKSNRAFGSYIQRSKTKKKNQMEHLGLTYRGLVDRHGMRSLEIPTGETDSPLPNILENVTLASDQHQIGWGHHNPE